LHNKFPELDYEILYFRLFSLKIVGLKFLVAISSKLTDYHFSTAGWPRHYVGAVLFLTHMPSRQIRLPARSRFGEGRRNNKGAFAMTGRFLFWELHRVGP
jgi:hypothetical protein